MLIGKCRHHSVINAKYTFKKESNKYYQNEVALNIARVFSHSKLNWVFFLDIQTITFLVVKISIIGSDYLGTLHFKKHSIWHIIIHTSRWFP